MLLNVIEYVMSRFVVEATVIRQKMAQKLKDDSRAAMKRIQGAGGESREDVTAAEGNRELQGEDLGVRPLPDVHPITE